VVAGHVDHISDVAGNPAVEATHSLTVDETAPTAPAITSAAAASGNWNLSGTAEANSTVTVFDGVTQVGTAVANGGGTWSLTGAASTSIVRTFTATATDIAGNTGPASASWIEGTSGNDTFAFASGVALAAPAVIVGDGGADTILLTAATTLIDSDFINVSGVQTLTLNGANTVGLGIKAASAGITTLNIGSGATSVTDTGTALSVGATALADNAALSLSGSTNFTVTGLQGDISGGGVAGALNVTTVAVATGLSVATGSGSNTINASALTSGEALTMTGSSAATVTLNGGNLSAGSYTGNLTVTLGAADTVTAGSGNDAVTLGSHTGSYTINLGAGTNTVNALTTTGSATINATGTAGTSDSLTGNGSDTLVLTGTSGALDLSKLNAFTGFATVTLNGSSESLTLKSAQNITVNGGGTGDAVTLATHAGTDTIGFAVGTNTVNAVTTTGSATINATGTAGTSDSLTGNGSDTLVLTGTSGALDLSKLNAFTGFTTVTLNGSSESLTLKNGQNLTVAGGSGNTVTLGTGNDTVSFTGGTNTVNATSSTLNAGDSLTGGSGTDTLALTGAGTFDLNSLAAFTGFKNVTLGTSGESLTLKNGQNLTVTTFAEAAGNTEAVTLGTGNDTVTFSGAGTNTVNATAATLNSADSLIGGSGPDTLALTGGGTFNLSGLTAFSNMDTVTLDNSSSTVVLRLATTLTVTGGTGTNIFDLSHGTGSVTIDLGAASFSGGGFNPTTFSNMKGVVDTNFGDTITAIASGSMITPGSGADKITLGGGGATVFYKATADSTSAAVDTINSFTPGSDKLDFTAISGFNGATVTVVTGSPPSTIAAHTINLHHHAGNTEVYANASGSTEAGTSAYDMQIHLPGVSVATTDIIHA